MFKLLLGILLAICGVAFTVFAYHFNYEFIRYSKFTDLVHQIWFTLWAIASYLGAYALIKTNEEE